MNKEKTASQIAIEIVSVTNAGGQEITQKIIATDLYVYFEVAEKQFIYLPGKEGQYSIDTTNKRLKNIDISAQVAQFMQIKQLIGELKVEESPSEESIRRRLHLTNPAATVINIDIEADILAFDGLEKTVLNKFNDFQAPIQPFSIKVNTNEVIASMKACIVFGEQVQQSGMQLIEIQKLSNTSLFDEYLDFAIAK